MRKLMATGAGGLRRSPIQHGVMFSQRRIVVIHHSHRTVVAGVGSRVQRAKTENTFFQRNAFAAAIPADERLAVAAINPGTFGWKIVAQRVSFVAFAAHHHPAGARHREVRLMLKAMNFDDVS